MLSATRCCADGQLAITELPGATEANVLLVAGAESGSELRTQLERACAGAGLAGPSGCGHLNRVRGRHRMAAIADTAMAAARSLLERCQSSDFDAPLPQPAAPIFLFTGQGSQYAGMGRGLYEHHELFRSCMDACSELFRPYLPTPLVEVLYSEAIDPDEVDTTLYTQPALFALEVSLARLWIAAGVEPAALLGHSIGELGAAHIAGVLELAAAVQLVGTRAQLMNAMPRSGAMLSANTSERTILERIGALGLTLDIAAINGRESVVVSGDAVDIAVMEADLAAGGVSTRALTVSHAFHSALMEPMLESFEAAIRDLPYRSPSRRLLSNLCGGLIPAEQVPGAAYYRAHVRNPVQFAACLNAVDELGFDLYLEIGPHATLSAMARRHLGRGRRTWLSSLRNDEDAVTSCLRAAIRLFERGAELRWEHVLGAP